MQFGIPIFGTMAHSLIQAHDREEQAFEHFALAQPNNVVLLIDTYDVQQATHKVVQLGQRLKARGIAIQGVRLDSGDLAAYAHQVRKILDAGGLPEVTIFCSSDLDEYQIQALLEKQAPIDGFGVGTRLDISTDAPFLDCVYKLQEYAGIARRKRSPGKTTWPGRKQIYRHTQDGVLAGDWLGLENDSQTLGEPLLQRVMHEGQRCQMAPPLETLRDRVKSELTKLPSALRTNGTTPPYPVHITPALQKLADQFDDNPH
jgi:nicotinate phosphoribosyltransferase